MIADYDGSRDGDLRRDTELEASILHRFAVPSIARDGSPFALERTFDLGVGGEGIIGRRVSLIGRDGVLGQGILGWN